jgi:hypothetical protein
MVRFKNWILFSPFVKRGLETSLLISKFRIDGSVRISECEQIVKDLISNSMTCDILQVVQEDYIVNITHTFYV